MRKGLVVSAIALIVGMCVAGCGYTSKSLLPSDYKTIFVTNFANDVNVTAEATDARMYRGYRPGMEITLTNTVINRFVFDGNLQVAHEEDADLILKGTLIDYRQEPLRYDMNENIDEFRIRIVVSLELIDKKTLKTLWKEKRFAGETTYRTSGSLAKTEDVAIQDANFDLARRIVERTVEGW